MEAAAQGGDAQVRVGAHRALQAAERRAFLLGLSVPRLGCTRLPLLPAAAAVAASAGSFI